ncbi:rod shape-determining protein [Sphingomonas parva]|uniref:Cell shape-determining protein MreB n=1 Tax=Sphingomonas parva TaxID=2555898 RepID=A0A4Y8ZRU2_9SPHN|nr:rod shape-determining protein [Sphingomonas parva]TFI58012.1 rod shape-determining protein [Sphingomonas parva]
MFHIQRGVAPRADLAIDLGTANTLVVGRGAGIIFNEPTLCCFRAGGQAPELVAAGRQAQDLSGRVAKPLRIVRPLKNGVLSDMTAASALIRYAVRRHRSGWRLGRPRALIGVPADATQAERSALEAAARDAGLAEPRLVAEPFVSAVGAGLPVDAPRGTMIVDCGAGTTEVAVISLGGICVSRSVRGGSDGLDQAIVDHLHLKHRFDIGPATAERLKRELSSLLETGEADRMVPVCGLDMAEGLPSTISVPAAELMRIWNRYIESIVSAVRDALSRTPPGLAEDIHEDGITLTGGAAMTGLLARRIAEETGLPTHVAETPLDSVAAGLARMIDG